MAGNSTLCKEMLNHVKNTMEIYGVNGDIHVAAELARAYIQRWQSEAGKKFDGSALIVGWKNNNESFHPYIYGVNDQEFAHTSTNYEAYTNGTGGEYAFPYYKNHKKGNSREEMLELMKEALLYAAIWDRRSGGILRVAEVRPFGCNKVYSQRVLEVLFNHYDAMANYLSHSLFSLWYNCDHEYTCVHNEKVEKVLEKELRDYYYSVVVGKNRKFVVRLLHFKCPVYGKFEQLKESCTFWVRNFEIHSQPKPQHLYDCDVPREVRDLPWIILKGFDSPIVFGEATQNLVKLLRDV